ncbi:MAG: DegV family protein [Eubacteriales bacterium]|nr:DegV family protein [Eubacteriales bacterium]
MSNFRIFTDSTCDLAPEVYKEWGVEYFKLAFYFTDDESVRYRDGDIPANEFYDEMRKGRTAKTSGSNPGDIREKMEPVLKAGEDILYLGFASVLSNSFSVAKLTADELMEEYPDRKIICVDSCSQSAGQALVLKFVLDKKNSGASLEETAQYAEEIKLHVAHWFTVDNLVYLKRGGRLSAASAVIGTVLNIKPIIHTDNEGRLVAVEKVRGRKNAMNFIIDKYGEEAVHPGEGPLYFCNSDCMEDVEYMKNRLKEKFGVDTDLVVDIGPVIGSHVGPGTISIFYECKNR